MIMSCCLSSILRTSGCIYPLFAKSRSAISLQHVHMLSSRPDLLSISTDHNVGRISFKNLHIASNDKALFISNIDQEKLDTSCRKFHNPTEAEVAKLKRTFGENPIQLIESLFGLLSNNLSDFITVKSTQVYHGLVWEVALQFSWPGKFQVIASHTDHQHALENAYFFACGIFKSIKLIKSNGNGTARVVDLDLVHRIIAEYKNLTDIFDSSFVTMTTREVSNCGEKLWQTDLSLRWLLEESVSAVRKDPTFAQNMTVLTMIQKSKLFAKILQVQPDKVPEMCRRLVVGLYKTGKLKDVENFEADFEIYMDASRKGFGACLINKEDSSMRWFSNKWPGQLKDDEQLLFVNRQCISTNYPMCIMFCELYALVTALFTWKHKFEGKKVLCYSDCLNAVKLANMIRICHDGYIYTINKRFQKLFQILLETCQSRNICIKAVHVESKKNKADILSRDQADVFLRIYPNSFPISKKPKQLLFWPPLTKGVLKPRLEHVLQSNKEL